MTKEHLKKLEDRIAALEAQLSKGKLHIAVVQDKSSSMHSRTAGVIDGFNEYIDTLREEEADADAHFTLTQFNGKSTIVQEDVPLADVKPLDTTSYQTSGMTALLDAVGLTVSRLDEAMAKNDRAIVVVMTDGGENSSRQYDHATISKLIETKQATERWTFVYIGADQDAWSVGTGLGFSAGNTISMANTSESYKTTFKKLAGGQNLYRSRGMGATASFTSDLFDAVDDDGKPKTDG